MKKINKNYFENSSVALIGYSSKRDSFSRMAAKELVKAGIKVYPINRNSEASYDVKVYNSIEDLPSLPNIAYILTSRENTKSVIEDVKNSGINKILIQSKKMIDNETVKMCESSNIEVTYGCPLMAAGKGLHRFHGFLAGVK